MFCFCSDLITHLKCVIICKIIILNLRRATILFINLLFFNLISNNISLAYISLKLQLIKLYFCAFYVDVSLLFLNLMCYFAFKLYKNNYFFKGKHSLLLQICLWPFFASIYICKITLHIFYKSCPCIVMYPDSFV